MRVPIHNLLVVSLHYAVQTIPVLLFAMNKRTDAS